MTPDKSFNLQMRTQQLRPDDHGHAQWETILTEQDVPAVKTALLICDMWDGHWSRGACERVEAMVPRFNVVVRAVRQAGAAIIHAPSETMAFYEQSPARQRMQAQVPVKPPRNCKHPDPKLPVDDSDGGSDTGEKPWFKAWTRQHPGIEINEALDGISDNGLEIYSFLRTHGIQQVLLAGVHTNMCVLNRSFAIKQMVRWGVPIALVRDLTDAMYNPARPPYVSHAEGTRLIVEYIEKFWCPTILSDELCR
jgi:nicotinamidase-related amidase